MLIPIIIRTQKNLRQIEPKRSKSKDRAEGMTRWWVFKTLTSIASCLDLNVQLSFSAPHLIKKVICGLITGICRKKKILKGKNTYMHPQLYKKKKISKMLHKNYISSFCNVVRYLLIFSKYMCLKNIQYRWVFKIKSKNKNDYFTSELKKSMEILFSPTISCPLWIHF